MSIKPNKARAKLFAHWLSEDANFMFGIQQKGAFLTQINQLLHQVLPENLQGELKLVNIQATRLIVYTTKATNLISFRFSKEKVLAELKVRLPWVTDIELKVRPAIKLSQPPLYRATRLTRHSKQSLAKLAEEVANPKLKQALLSLANKPENHNSVES